MYPQAAAPFEESGSNFTPPTMGALISDQRKLTEANRRLAALDTASRESYTFHETRARRLGIDSPAGMAHLKAARAIRAGRLSNLYEHGDEIGELDPKAIMRANRDAVSWHKKRAEKHGLDSDIGHAHVAMLSDHLNAFNKAKKQLASVAGVAGRQSPLAVPEKSKQPSEDIRQRKPIVKLQQGRIDAGGPGSGPRPGQRRGGGWASEEQKRKALGPEEYAKVKDLAAQRAEQQRKERDERIMSNVRAERERRRALAGKESRYLAPRYEKSHEARRLKREAALKEFGKR